MRLKINSHGDGFTSLYQWLAISPELNRIVGFEPDSFDMESKDDGSESMGSAEVINAVVANALALGSLLVSIANWREAHTCRPKVTVSRGKTTVVLEDTSVDEAHRLAKELADAVEEAHPGEPV